jgi:hypothetical protein
MVTLFGLFFNFYLIFYCRGQNSYCVKSFLKFLFIGKKVTLLVTLFNQKNQFKRREKMQEEILSYKELCEKFGEERAIKGKSRQLQFERWRQEYNIDKIDGKNKYAVTKKRFAETSNAKLQKRNMEFSTLLAPVIYQTLINATGNVVALSSLEEQRAFSLVNTQFCVQSLYLSAIANKIGVEPTELSKFKDTVWEINMQTIRNVINSMKRDKILLKNDGYKCQDLITGEWFIADGKFALEILCMTNKFAEETYGKGYAKLSKDQKRDIKEKTSEYFKFETYYSADVLYLDKEFMKIMFNSVKRDFDNLISNKERELESSLIELNDNNCVRLSKTKRKNVKDISKTNMNKMINAFISKGQKSCIEDYNNVVENSSKMKIYHSKQEYLDNNK